MMNRLLFYLVFCFCGTFSTAHAQDDSNIKKVEYQQGCSFCAGQRFISTLYVHNEGAFYTYKHDESDKSLDSEHSSIIDTSTRHIRFDLKSDSIYELGAMRSINPNGILIGEKRKQIEWNLVDSNQVVNGYSCKLAVGDFRGRQYYAWYDPAIKINLGPWKLHGLPGAVVYAEDTTGELYFKAIKFTDLPDVSAEQVVKRPVLPIIGRLKYRAMREEIYEHILNLKPEDESKFTYDIRLKKNYFEFE